MNMALNCGRLFLGNDQPRSIKASIAAVHSHFFRRHTMTDQPITTDRPAAPTVQRRLPPLSRSFIRGFLIGALAMLLADLAIGLVILSMATNVLGK
jgi:hypothetical protein